MNYLRMGGLKLSKMTKLLFKNEKENEKIYYKYYYYLSHNIFVNYFIYSMLFVELDILLVFNFLTFTILV